MTTPTPMHLPHALARAIIPIALGLLVSCGGSDGTGTEPTGDLTGTVREATRATPIADATVTAGNRQTTTAADGSFELSDIPVGDVTLNVSAPGYEPLEQAVSVQEGANQRDLQLSVKTFYEFGDFAAYIPPFVETLHGIVFVIGGFDRGSGDVVPGSPSTPRFPALQSALLTFAQAEDFAVLGEEVPRASVSDGPDLVRPALTALAGAVAHHPELQHAPVLLLGLSWGGCRAYEYTAAEGPRVIGFITMKGGCHPVSSQPLARLVPGYLFIGEDDTSARRENLTTAFEVNRSSGALWALAVEQGAGHTVIGDIGLMFQWMGAVASLRLPESVTPGQPVVLRTIDEAEGWLGNRVTFETCAFDCYVGDPDNAAWLPSSETATRWAAFVSASGGGGGGGGLSARPAER